MIIAGLMSGTSADGLDVALVEFTPSEDRESGELLMRVLASQEVPFDESLTRDILRLLEPRDVPLALVSRVDAALGQFSATAVTELCAKNNLSCDLVVSHGQTVRHEIDSGTVTATLQLGQPAWIAETVGAPVLSDVRARDVAAGGQGAPLASLMDHLLVAKAEQPTALLNLGGIANITAVSPSGESVAFDTGPANALIDLMARRISRNSWACDRDGILAACGRTDPALLQHLLEEPYYQQPAPKSSGKELFHADYLDEHLQTHPGVEALDVIATLTRLTARTVAEACRAHGVCSVVASGGGTRNPTLMAALREELGTSTPVRTTDEAFGLPEGAKEACLVALIGWFSWHGLPATLPWATGASRSTVAGRISPGAGPLELPAPRMYSPSSLRVIP
ncbi:anhydro-N-acetylmuramic acid kinase [Nesterenkonia haasae]|uniref:anhydro-N-acetylmuramic acid kinase n=1 Tax=Nesterenkonia haasae TaxID=2587813 RepID=UPI001390A8A2|nr:anhydro-N-acetylmuramic acid kinase [Nesterenkonia haasae]NDK31573.1 anhydro-N-acetylmuramic acid kinase [Nesterenkonia haasae]